MRNLNHINHINFIKPYKDDLIISNEQTNKIICDRDNFIIKSFDTNNHYNFINTFSWNVIDYYRTKRITKAAYGLFY